MICCIVTLVLLRGTGWGRGLDLGLMVPVVVLGGVSGCLRKKAKGKDELS